MTMAPLLVVTSAGAGVAGNVGASAGGRTEPDARRASDVGRDRRAIFATCDAASGPAKGAKASASSFTVA